MESKIIPFRVTPHPPSLSLICHRHCIAAWTGDDLSVDQRLTIAYSPLSSLSIRLPSTDLRQASGINLRVLICDLLDCVTEVNISSVLVSPDTVAIDRLINEIHSSSSTQLTMNRLVQSLSSGNQNLVTQVITAVSQQINTMNTDTIDQAIQSDSTWI
jgi:hypothetical protein